MSVTVIQCGVMEYMEAWLMQTGIRERIIRGDASDSLLLVEHPPVITIGKSGTTDNVLISGADLERRRISLFFTDRGGDVTFHGPGQLVVYPLIDLRNKDKDGHKFVHDLEETAIRTLQDYGIPGVRDDSHAGIWIGNNEIAAIGISISRWITMHGMALNVTTNLQPFSFIHPCGFSDRGAVSMSQFLAENVTVAEVTPVFLKHFGDVFMTDLTIISSEKYRESIDEQPAS